MGKVVAVLLDRMKHPQSIIIFFDVMDMQAVRAVVRILMLIQTIGVQVIPLIFPAHFTGFRAGNSHSFRYTTNG